MTHTGTTAGLLSWFKLFDSNFLHSLKLSLVWFDQLVMQCPRSFSESEHLSKTLAEAGASEDTRDTVFGVLKPVEHYIPDYIFGELDVWDGDSHISASTRRVMEDYVAVKYLGKSNSDRWPDQDWLEYEIRCTGAAAIDALNLLSSLSDQFCTILIPTANEHRVVSEIMRPLAANTTFDLFQTVADFRLPSLKDMSWDQVIEIRYHKYAENFRKVLYDLRVELVSFDPASIKEIFTQIERKNLRELLSILKPSVPGAIAKGIATNIPLPIPINPAGIWDAINSVRQEKMIDDKYGWLYFLFELT